MINAIRKFIARRKGRQVVEFVDALAAASEQQMSALLPLAFQLYRDTAAAVVERTERDPLPLLNLLDALEKCAAHYAPAGAPFKVYLAGVAAALPQFEEGQQRLVAASAALSE